MKETQRDASEESEDHDAGPSLYLNQALNPADATVRRDKVSTYTGS
ncbi:MAG TPA: hypothetical protein V6C97_10425 [Oculatellaceae cyanobacterium]